MSKPFKNVITLLFLFSLSAKLYVVTTAGLRATSRTIINKKENAYHATACAHTEKLTLTNDRWQCNDVNERRNWAWISDKTGLWRKISSVTVLDYDRLQWKISDFDRFLLCRRRDTREARLDLVRDIFQYLPPQCWDPSVSFWEKRRMKTLVTTVLY